MCSADNDSTYYSDPDLHKDDPFMNQQQGRSSRPLPTIHQSLPAADNNNTFSNGYCAEDLYEAMSDSERCSVTG